MDKEDSRFEGLAGTVKGSFFRSPKWVNNLQPPGMTDQTKSLLEENPFAGFFWGSHIIFSPNLIWLTISLVVYFAFPYDLDMAAFNEAQSQTESLMLSFILVRFFPRFMVNFAVTFTYTLYWHAILYWKTKEPLSRRSFNQARVYRVGKVIHNIYYSTLGIAQWSLWEAVFVHCFASGRLPYLSNNEAVSSLSGLLTFSIWVLIIPFWRSVHFYFAHRLIHLRVLYKYIHSLHHRNVDTEPFSGISMHPVEHLYYFSCFLPSLYFYMSPFALLFNGMHLLLSPVAAHSGWEDHWQSDQYHYLHHRFFECNYGSPGIGFYLDYYMGTFRESLDPKSKSYKGAHVSSRISVEKSQVRVICDKKASLYGIPKTEELLYNSICILILLLSMSSYTRFQSPIASGWLLALGPIVAAIVMETLIGLSTKNARRKYLYPFHRERLFGPLGAHTIFALIFCVLPIYHIIETALTMPGNGPYFYFRGSI